MPASREAVDEADLVLGVRPEHVRFSDAGAVRGGVFGAEYLGTTQIVTVETAVGIVKARAPSTLPLATGETRGAGFPAREAVASSTRRPGGRSAPRCMRGAGHG